MWFLVEGGEEKDMKLLECGREKARGRKEIIKSNRGGEYDQSTLYVCMETSQ
jgi:hypothetical protein